MNVYTWTWGETPTRYQCESVDEPDVNSTALDAVASKELFVGAWNTKHSTTLTVDDFTFIPKPE